MGTTSLTRSSTPYSGWDTTIPSMESIKDMDTRSMDTMVMGVGLMVEATEVMVMMGATTVADPTTTSIMDTLESTTTVTANATGTRAMATTSMTMTAVTTTIMMVMATMTTMDMGMMEDMMPMKIPMVLGANTDGTGVTVTTTGPTTDLVEATSHSSVSINSSILWATKELLTPHGIQSMPTKDPWVTLHRIRSSLIKYPGMQRFPNILCNLDNRCYLLIIHIQSINLISQHKCNQYHSPLSLRMPQK